jgi:hypothetical protein
MKELYIQLGSLSAGILVILVYIRIKIYLENRRFIKEIDHMIAEQGKRHTDALLKCLEASMPLIIDIIERNKSSAGKLHSFTLKQLLI